MYIKYGRQLLPLYGIVIVVTVIILFFTRGENIFIGLIDAIIPVKNAIGFYINKG